MVVESIDLYDYFHAERKGASGGCITVYARAQNGELPPKKRPAILVIPGGGYDFLSEREGEPVALRFLAEGYVSFLLSYTLKTAYPTPLAEALMAVAYIHEKADVFGINKDHVAVIGFSAGGHLAGLLATATEQEADGFLCKNVRFSIPNAVIMSYPVVTLGNGTNVGTCENITGGDSSLHDELSIENRVRKDCPPIFVWHTSDDDCVPVENAFMLASACKSEDVPYSLHIFEKGYHGLSLCNAETDCRTENDVMLSHVGKWVDLALDFLSVHGFSVN